MTANKRLLRVSDLAHELGIGRSTAWNLVLSGAIGSIKISPRVRRVPAHCVDDFIQAQLEEQRAHGALAGHAERPAPAGSTGPANRQSSL